MDKARYKVVYTGYIFDGDTMGVNVRFADRLDDVVWMLNAYDGVEITDTQYGITYTNDHTFN